MQKDLFYYAIDVSKDKLDLDAAAPALPAQLGNDQAGFRQLNLFSKPPGPTIWGWPWRCGKQKFL